MSEVAVKEVVEELLERVKVLENKTTNGYWKYVEWRSGESVSSGNHIGGSTKVNNSDFGTDVYNALQKGPCIGVVSCNESLSNSMKLVTNFSYNKDSGYLSYSAENVGSSTLSVDVGFWVFIEE